MGKINTYLLVVPTVSAVVEIVVETDVAVGSVEVEVMLVASANLKNIKIFLNSFKLIV